MAKSKPAGKPAVMGRPVTVDIDPVKLKAFMRLAPNRADTAAWFQCSEDTIERFIRKNYDLTYAAFREQNMVVTRRRLIRKAIFEATKENCNTAMLIFCLKNLCKWTDKVEVTPPKDDDNPELDRLSNDDLKKLL